MNNQPCWQCAVYVVHMIFASSQGLTQSSHLCVCVHPWYPCKRNCTEMDTNAVQPYLPRHLGLKKAFRLLNVGIAEAKVYVNANPHHLQGKAPLEIVLDVTDGALSKSVVACSCHQRQFTKHFSDRMLDCCFDTVCLQVSTSCHPLPYDARRH